MKRSILALLFIAFTSPLWAQPLNSSDRAAVLSTSRKAVPGKSRLALSKASGGYAKVAITSPGLDTATLYLRKTGGKWKVIAGPGTAWSATEFDRLHIPPGLR